LTSIYYYKDFHQHEDVAAFYQSLARIDLNYGPAFQTIWQLRVDQESGRVLSRIKMQPELTANLSQYCIHPTVLDACFQSLIAMLDGSDTTYLPTGFSEMCVYSKQVPANVWCLSEIVTQTDREIDCNLTLIDDEGNVVATIRGMRSTAAAKKERTDRFGDKVKRQILGYEWTYGETLNEAKRLGYWLVVGSDSQVAPELIQRLESYGAIGISSVIVGKEFQTADGQMTVRPGHVEDAKDVLKQCGELDGIVFLHGLTATADSIDPTGETAIETLIAFSQALIQQSSEQVPRVYVVTQGAFAVNDQDKHIQPSQSALNGFTRVAFNELEGLRFSSIDLPTKVSEDSVESLALELLCDDIHDEVALRGNFRLVSELVDSPMLTDDRIQYMNLDDEHPMLVRPLLAETEGVGMARNGHGSKKAVFG
jgi:hypothetical protein